MFRVGSGYSASTGAIAGWTPTLVSTPLIGMIPCRASASGTVAMRVRPSVCLMPS